MLQKPDLAGRMVTWSIQLFEFDISFERRGHKKAQTLTDFIMELTPDGQLASEGKEWFLSIDGASNQAESGTRVILEGPDGVLIEQFLHFEFKARNNQAEYETLLVEMRLARELEAKILTAKSDSKLGELRIPREGSPIDQILGESNGDGSHIRKIYTFACTTRPKQKGGLVVEAVHKPTIEKQEVCCVGEKTVWISLFLEYLGEDQLLSDATKAKKLVREASKYTLIGQQLYRRGFSFLLLRCVDEDGSEYIISEVHEGVCGTHIGGRALASKIAKADYY
ncbi:hypothetical protein CR513_52758, partial [Mucuna pruriens]